MRRRSSDRSNRSRLARAAYLLACGIALASIGWACSGDEGTPPQPSASPAEPAQAQPAPSEAARPAAPGEAAQGDTIASEGVVPEGYPTDVPVYPGSTPGSSMTMPGLGVFATFESDDTVDKIVEHYRTELTKGGWSVTDSPDGGGVDATKGNRSVQVRARKDDQGHSEIAVNVSQS
jgi:hypothetical protein